MKYVKKVIYFDNNILLSSDLVNNRLILSKELLYCIQFPNAFPVNLQACLNQQNKNSILHFSSHDFYLQL